MNIPNMCIDAFLKSNDLSDVVNYYRDSLASGGALIRLPESADSSETVTTIPAMLFPVAIPSDLFDLVSRIQPHFNRLLHRVAMDRNFLETELRHVIANDTFTARLWDIYCKVYSRAGDAAPRHFIYIGTVRNDYMLHDTKENETQIKQVEYNLTAVSFGPLCSIVSRKVAALCDRVMAPEEKLRVPATNPHIDMASAVVAAAIKYDQLYATTDSGVLFVVDRPSRNIFDQRWIEFSVNEAAPRRRTIRRTFDQLLTCVDFNKLRNDRIMMIDGYEFSVIYMRTGYDADHYRNEEEWTLRELIELSRAAVTPCVAHQLANYKKVQQALSRPGVLERFSEDAKLFADIRSTFIEQHSLEFTEENEAFLSLALETPGDFVLKPQQEGGGHNYYGDDVKRKLLELRSLPERQNFILMRRINAPFFRNLPVARNVVPEVGLFNAELGIYGAFVVVDNVDKEKRSTEWRFNEGFGYLVRCKSVKSNESGVAAGYGLIGAIALM